MGEKGGEEGGKFGECSQTAFRLNAFCLKSRIFNLEVVRHASLKACQQAKTRLTYAALNVCGFIL